MKHYKIIDRKANTYPLWFQSFPTYTQTQDVLCWLRTLQKQAPIALGQLSTRV